MYSVSLRLITVQACKRRLQHPHEFDTGRPNWRRICHPSFLPYWTSSKLGPL